MSRKATTPDVDPLTKALNGCFVGDRVCKGDVEATIRRFFAQGDEHAASWCELVTDAGDLLKYSAFDAGWSVVDIEEAPLPPEEPFDQATPEQAEMPLERLWPDFEGHPVREVDLALGGTAKLRSSDRFAQLLAPRLHGNAKVTIIGTYRVEGIGHKVEYFDGVAIGRIGTAKLRLIDVTDDDGLANRLHTAYEREADVIGEIDQFIERYGGDAESENPVRDAFVRLGRMLLIGRERTDAEEARARRDAEKRAAERAANPGLL